MRNYLVPLTILGILIIAGCGSNYLQQSENQFQDMVNEAMGETVLIPQLNGLEINQIKVISNNFSDPIELVISYSTEGSLTEYYGDSEFVKEFERLSNSKYLYGPYEGEQVFVYFYEKNVAFLETSSSYFNVSDIIVNMQEQTEENIFQYHFFLYDGDKYTLGYNMDIFQDKEIQKITTSLIKTLK